MPIPRLTTKVALLIAMLVITPMTGCVPWARGIRSLDDTVTDWRDFVWGKRAYFQRYGNGQSGPFRDGFLEGYHDILQGGDGCLPVVPPKRYWGWRYQSAGGQAAVGDWFNGYSAGVAAAKEDGMAGLSCVPMSSQYNGASSVPIEAMPSGEDEWGPIESIQPREIPSPSVEPPSPSKIETGAKGTTRFSRGAPPIRPVSMNQPLSTPIPLTAQAIPFGSGTIQVSPPSIEPPRNDSGRNGSGQASSTSRRGNGKPLSMSPVPVLSQPYNSNAGLPASNSDTPLPIRR